MLKLAHRDEELPARLHGVGGTGSVVLNAPIYLISVRVLLLLYAYAHIARLGLLGKCCVYGW